MTTRPRPAPAVVHPSQPQSATARPAMRSSPNPHHCTARRGRGPPSAAVRDEQRCPQGCRPSCTCRERGSEIGVGVCGDFLFLFLCLTMILSNLQRARERETHGTVLGMSGCLHCTPLRPPLIALGHHARGCHGRGGGAWNRSGSRHPQTSARRG